MRTDRMRPCPGATAAAAVAVAAVPGHPLSVREPDLVSVLQ